MYEVRNYCDNYVIKKKNNLLANARDRNVLLNGKVSYS